MFITFSEGVPSVSYGERTVMDIDVIGNMLGFGFPASKDIMPGTDSSGKSSRTRGRGEDQSTLQGCRWRQLTGARKSYPGMRR